MGEILFFVLTYAVSMYDICLIDLFIKQREEYKVFFSMKLTEYDVSKLNF